MRVEESKSGLQFKDQVRPFGNDPSAPRTQKQDLELGSTSPPFPTVLATPVDASEKNSERNSAFGKSTGRIRLWVWLSLIALVVLAVVVVAVVFASTSSSSRNTGNGSTTTGCNNSIDLQNSNLNGDVVITQSCGGGN